MSTQDKTWSWASSAESWSFTAGNSNVTGAWDSGYGNAAGSLYFNAGPAKNIPSNTSYWEISGTWESLFGIGTNNSVTNIQFLSGDRRCTIYTGIINDATIGAIEVRDSAGTTVIATLKSSYTYTGVSSGWDSWGAGTSQSIAAGYQPSNTTIRIRVNFTSNTGNDKTANAKVYIDNMAFQITYQSALTYKDFSGTAAVASTTSTPNLDVAAGFKSFTTGFPPLSDRDLPRYGVVPQFDHYWDFNNSYADMYGPGATLQLSFSEQGGGAFTWQNDWAGRSNQAIQADGTNYLQAGSSGGEPDYTFGTSTFTILCSFKTNSLSANDVRLFGCNNGTVGWFFYVGVSGGTGAIWWFLGGYNWGYVNDVTIYANTNYHVVLCRTGQYTGFCFINGVEGTLSASPFGDFNNHSGYLLAFQDGQGNPCSSGVQMHQLGLHKGSITKAQARALYNTWVDCGSGTYKRYVDNPVSTTMLPVIYSATSTPNLSTLAYKLFAGSADIVSATSGPKLGRILPFSGVSGIVSATTTPKLGRILPFAGTVGIVSATTTPNLRRYSNFFATAAVVSTTTTPVLRRYANFLGQIDVVSYCPDPDLSIIMGETYKDFVGAADIVSATSLANLMRYGNFLGAANSVSATSSPKLGRILPFSGSIDITTVTTTPALRRYSNFLGTSALVSATSTPAINLYANYVGLSAIASLTSTPVLRRYSNFAGVSGVASTTSSPKLGRILPFAGTVAVVSATSTPTLMRDAHFSGLAAIASATSTPALRRYSNFVGQVNIVSATSEADLMRIASFSGSVDIISVTPLVDLLRIMNFSGQIDIVSYCPDANLSLVGETYKDFAGAADMVTATSTPVLRRYANFLGAIGMVTSVLEAHLNRYANFVGSAVVTSYTADVDLLRIMNFSGSVDMVTWTSTPNLGDLGGVSEMGYCFIDDNKRRR